MRRHAGKQPNTTGRQNWAMIAGWPPTTCRRVNGVAGRQTPAFRDDLNAFAAGMNAYAMAHPQELDDAARRVFPVDARDVIAHAMRVFQFVYAAPMNVADKLPPDAPPMPSPPHESAGSNGWAIAPSRAESGRAMLLMNPHLPWVSGGRRLTMRFS